ncbi:protein toll-like [Drosophila albomicans]|uniref:Protein toll-like n=1 Tax=Drosophila albomicans TaxID=7291 RepID=A0A9C6WCW3_DROAB|nr:protein toll-like [Drosophila albomicans]
MFIILYFLYFRCKIFLLMWLYENGYCLRWISRPEPGENLLMKHDAFLAFCHVDLKYAEEFVEALENGPKKYNVCYYNRDWLLGESIPECILTSIEDSKRTIILMTQDFINSSWGRFEFRSAIKATSEDKHKRLIVILYPDVNVDALDSEFRSYLKYNTYLNRDDPHFWRKLKFAMPYNHIRNELTDSET